MSTDLPDIKKRLTREEVFQTVCRIIAAESDVPAEAMAEKSHVLNDLGCDSLAVIEIAMEIEEEFNVNVPDDQVEEAETVGQIVDEVFKLVNETAGA
jgi:acyl carrier protein